MDVTAKTRDAIESCFASIGGVKSFSPFGRPSPPQQECAAYVRARRHELFTAKSRDVYLPELLLCISGMQDEEDGELITEGTFSQYRFYSFYIGNLVYYPEKFDFLLRCVEESVVLVKATSKFLNLMQRVLDLTVDRAIPEDVIDYERLLEEDEEERISRFVLKKDWISKVPDVEDVQHRQHKEESDSYH